MPAGESNIFNGSPSRKIHVAVEARQLGGSEVSDGSNGDRIKIECGPIDNGTVGVYDRRYCRSLIGKEIWRHLRCGTRCGGNEREGRNETLPKTNMTFFVLGGGGGGLGKRVSLEKRFLKEDYKIQARCNSNIKNVRMLPMQVARWIISFNSEIKNVIRKSPIRENSREKWFVSQMVMLQLEESEETLEDSGLLGLNLAKRKGLRNSEFGVDSAAVVSLLREACNDDHHLSALIKDCRSLMVKVNTVKINHTFKEGNKYADHLASLGYNSRPGVCELLNPPDSLFSFSKQ
ncbi:Ribonuclease H domain [Dillenia turbinata]|uniref:Ribonuclease H domain n=1 Tax=Dillenia turbinata TaxID=194707 RepID=A0AAN8V7B8_9MAGN